MASNGVNVKMGVSGVAQFKNAMKQAQTSVKTLDAELALNEKQYKASGDAEAYMEQKAELLRKKMEEQKSAISAAEQALKQMNDNGVDKASSAYQNMQQALANAKSGLIDTTTQLDNVGSAALDAEQQVGGMNDKLLESMNKKISFQNVTDGLNKITDGMQLVINKAFQVGKSIVDATLGAGGWADTLQTTADQYGVSPEKLYRMQQTADLIDTDADTILAAKDKMNKALHSGGEVAEMLDLLGVGNVVSTDSWDNFWEIGEAIKNMGDEETQTAAAQKIFGKSWRELMPLFNAGREEYEKTMKSWSWVGDDNFKALTQMDDQFQTLNNEVQTLGTTLLSTMAGPMTDVMKALTGLVQQFNTYLQTDEGKEKMEAISAAVSSLFTDLSNMDPEDVMNKVIGVVDKLKEGLDWFAANGDTVVNVAKGFVEAWMGLKVTSGITSVLQMINGFKGLMGGGSSVPVSSHPTGNQGVNGAPAALAGGNPVTNWLTAAAAKGSSYIQTLGGLPGVVTDMFMNQTNTGRAVRDGTSIWEGMATDVQERAAEIESNASTFFDDWGQLYTTITGFLDQKMSDEEAADYEDYSNALSRMIDEDMYRVPEYTWRGNQDEKQPSWVTSMVSQISEIVESVKGMNIYMDGQQVGDVVSPYIDASWGGLVVKMTK